MIGVTYFEGGRRGVETLCCGGVRSLIRGKEYLDQ